MKRSEAITHWFKLHKRSSRTVDILTKWRADKDIYWNAKLAGMSPMTARTWATNNKMKFLKRSKKPNPPSKNMLRDTAIVVLRRNGWSFDVIARLFNISEQRVFYILKQRERIK